jgi:hypothetical protein
MERRDSGVKQYFGQFVPAGVLSFVTATLLAPLDRLKLIRQTQDFHTSNVRYRSFFNYLASIRKREGITGYWRGNGANLTRIFLNSILRYKSFKFV